MIAFRRHMPRLPGTILALVAGTAAVALSGLDVETIGTRFGGIPSGLPDASIPIFEAIAHPRAHTPRTHRSDARGNRVADVGRRGGSYERRPSQPERGACRPGDRQHRLADLWWSAGNRRHRPDGDQYPAAARVPRLPA